MGSIMADSDDRAKRHTLADHRLGTDLAHVHDGEADHDEDRCGHDGLVHRRHAGKKSPCVLRDLFEAPAFRCHPETIVGEGDLLQPVHEPMRQLLREKNLSAIAMECDLVAEGVEQVDVTIELVRFFEPSDQTLAIVEDLRDKAPLSLLELADLPADQ